MEALALCHTVITEKDEFGRTNYQSSSPEELALVNAARSFGFKFKQAEKHQYTIEVFNEIKSYEVIAVNEYTPERKMMSIVLLRGNEGWLIAKGADEAIL